MSCRASCNSSSMRKTSSRQCSTGLGMADLRNLCRRSTPINADELDEDRSAFIGVDLRLTLPNKIQHAGAVEQSKFRRCKSLRRLGERFERDRPVVGEPPQAIVKFAQG